MGQAGPKRGKGNMFKEVWGQPPQRQKKLEDKVISPEKAEKVELIARILIWDKNLEVQIF